MGAPGNLAQRLRHDYSSTNVTTSAWIEVAGAGTLNGRSHGIEIFDSSGEELIFGIGLTTADVQEMGTVYPGGTDGVHRTELPNGTALLLFLKAVSGTASTGVCHISLYV